MKNIKWIFVLYSIAALVCMLLVGVAVGMRSVFGIITFLLLLFVVMGMGFKTKKKLADIE